MQKNRQLPVFYEAFGLMGSQPAAPKTKPT